MESVEGDAREFKLLPVYDIAGGRPLKGVNIADIAKAPDLHSIRGFLIGEDKYFIFSFVTIKGGGPLTLSSIACLFKVIHFIYFYLKMLYTLAKKILNYEIRVVWKDGIITTVARYGLF